MPIYWYQFSTEIPKVYSGSYEYTKCTKNESSSYVPCETLKFNIKNTIATCSIRKE